MAFPRGDRAQKEVGVSEIMFLGDQNGEFESHFKEQLKPVLASYKQVRAAFLVRVAYGEGSHGVALCLDAEESNKQEIIQEVGDVFRRIFRSDVLLDVIFLTQEESCAIRRTCNPFHLNESISGRN